MCKEASALFALIAAVCVSGCVAPSQMLVNAQGQVMRCSGQGWGYVGAPLAVHAVHNCTHDYEAIGYLPLEEAGKIGVAVDAKSANAAPIVTVQPGSPAAAAGVQVGDQIVAVNGQPVAGGAVALQQIFGRAGEQVTLTVKRGTEERAFTLTRVPTGMTPK